MAIRGSSGGIAGKITKRKAKVAAFALAGLLVATVGAIVRPKLYRAECAIAVRPAEGVAPDAALAKAEKASQQLARPEMLRRYVTELKLENEDPEELARNATVTVTPGGSGVCTITVAVADDDPDTAYRVVDRISTGFAIDTRQLPVEKQSRIVQADTQAADRAAAALKEGSDGLASFEKDSAAYLEDHGDRLKTLREKIELLEKTTVPELKKQHADARTVLESEPQFVTETVQAADPLAVASAERSLAAAKAELLRLTVEEKRTELDPAVVSQGQKVLEAQSLLDAARADTRESVVRRENAMYVSLRERVEEVGSKIGAATRQLAALRKNERDVEEQRDRAPEFRQRHEELKQKVAALKAAHDEAQGKLTASQARLDELKEESSLVYESVSAPEKPGTPEGPHAFLIAVIGLAAGLVAGAGVAVALDGMDHSFRTSEAVERYLGLPALGVIHTILTPGEAARRDAERRTTSRKLTLMAVFAAALLAAASLGADLWIAELLERAGG